MSMLITWEEIESTLKIFDYFESGLKPYNKNNRELIPCPDYCHSYHILLLTLDNQSEYINGPATLKQLNEWENEIKEKDSDSIPVIIRSEQCLDLMDSCLDISCHYNEEVNLTLENIKKLKETLDKHKTKYYERWKKMGWIRENDPETNSWEYFQKPGSEDNVDKLRALLSGAIFEKETYDGIKKRFKQAVITEDNHSKYITGRKLIERWDAEEFQIFEYIKNGLQPYSKFGKKIVNRNSLELSKKFTEDEILKRIRIEEGDYNTQFVRGVPSSGPFRKKFTDEEMAKKAKIEYAKQLLDVPIVPDDCIPADLHLPVNEKEAAEKIKNIMSFRFKRADVIQYENDNLSLMQKQPEQDKERCCINYLKDLKGFNQRPDTFEEIGTTPHEVLANEKVKSNTNDINEQGFEELLLAYSKELEPFYRELKCVIDFNYPNNADMASTDEKDITAAYQSLESSFEFMTLKHALKGSSAANNPSKEIKIPILREMIRDLEGGIYLQNSEICRNIDKLYKKYNAIKKNAQKNVLSV